MIFFRKTRLYFQRRKQIVEQWQKRLCSKDHYVNLSYEVYKKTDREKYKEFVVIRFTVDTNIFYYHVAQWNEKNNLRMFKKVQKIFSCSLKNDEDMYRFIKRNWKKFDW